MRRYVLNCFRLNNAKAGSALDLTCWLGLSTLHEVEELCWVLGDLAREGIIEAGETGFCLTTKGEAIVRSLSPIYPNGPERCHAAVTGYDSSV